MTVAALSRRDLISRRRARQSIAGPGLATPADVVRSLGAMQGQDYHGTVWAIGLRTASAGISDVEAAFAAGSIVRTWPLRGTLHVVPAADVRWLLALSGPRTIKASAGRYREFGLEQRTLTKANGVFERALSGGHQLTRPELAKVLQRARINTEGQRLIHLIQYASLEQVICFGARRGNQATLALLDEWVPKGPVPHGDEALARLALRYFAGHGPATPADLAWWSGQTLTDARRAIAGVASELETGEYQGTTYYWTADDSGEPAAPNRLHLLPGFDEFLLGYQDRSAVLDPRFAPLVCPGGNGMFVPTVVQGGEVIGTWARPAAAGRPITPRYFRPGKRATAKHLASAVDRYRRFLERAPGDGRVDTGGSAE